MDLVRERGYDTARAARDLGVPTTTLHLWLGKAGWVRPPEGGTGPDADTVTAPSQDPVRLRARVHHSGRGVQYACGDYRDLLRSHGIECSMSRRGDCYDNAVVESFFKTLKVELVYRERYETREQARRSVFEYVEVFYNRRRLHSSLGYVTPEQFEAAMN